MQAKESLWLNAEKTAIVPDGHPEAAILWAAPGDEVPDEAAERFGVEDGMAPRGKGKERKAPANKERQPEGDKTAKGKPGLTINKAKAGKR